MRREILPATFLALALAMGCGGYSPSAPPAPPAPPSPPAGSGQVAIQGFAFNPSPRTVAAGTTVTWVNRDAAPHTTTGGSGTETWDSGSLSQNGSFSHRFTVPGTYEYKCSIHQGMRGSIIVN